MQLRAEIGGWRYGTAGFVNFIFLRTGFYPCFHSLSVKSLAHSGRRRLHKKRRNQNPLGCLS